MTNAELDAAVRMLDQTGITSTFEKIVDTYGDGYHVKSLDPTKLAVLEGARLIMIRNGKASATSAGYSVSTRINANLGRRTIATRGPGHWRTR